VVVGIDESDTMLEHARRLLPHADFRVGRLEEELPTGPFDVVVSALAVHHLDVPHKADLFVRVAGIVTPGGRFVLSDVIAHDDPGDVVTPSTGSTTSRAPSPSSSSGSPTPGSSLTPRGSIETSPSWSATYLLVGRHSLDRSPIPA